MYTFDEHVDKPLEQRVSGKINKPFFLAPGVEATVVSERASLCKTTKEATHVCFWEGDCEFTAVVGGTTITVNDHDDRVNVQDKVSEFVLDGVQYKVVGSRFSLDRSLAVNDGRIHFWYTVYRNVPAENAVDDERLTLDLGEELTLSVFLDIDGGSTVQMRTSKELTHESTSFNVDETGVYGGVVTYVLRAERPGYAEVTATYTGARGKENTKTWSIYVSDTHVSDVHAEDSSDGSERGGWAVRTRTASNTNTKSMRYFDEYLRGDGVCTANHIDNIYPSCDRYREPLIML